MPALADRTDFIIVGGGIAGASIGHWLAPHGRVVLLEREDQPGYHSTGRSAALFMESYGTPQVRALTMASRAFLEHPPEGFTDHPILAARGALAVARPGEEALLDEQWRVVQSFTPNGRRLDASETCALVPVLRPEKVIGGVLEPDAADIDVHALHRGYLKGLRRAGGKVILRAEVRAVQRIGTDWHINASGCLHRAPVLINAAGAWCDAVASFASVAPIGLVPKRRSAFVFAPPEELETSGWPAISGVDHSWYVKPDAGLLLGSPANEDPMVPQDAQPEQIDIATGALRIEEMTTLQIRRPIRTWAGLRSFVADGDLVGGFDPDAPGFFWLAAQGGYGIQTSAAMGEACAALARGLRIPPQIAAYGLTEAMLGPARLRSHAAIV